MTSLLLAAVALLVLPSGVFPAYVDLGQICVPGTDTCVHTSLGLTCDKVSLKCMIKAEETCTGAGHNAFCVFGATCDGSSWKCKCAAGVYTATSGLCVNSAASPLYGGDCSLTTCESSSSNLQCRSTTPKVCVCSDGDFKLDPATGKCVDSTAKKIGHTCTADDASTCDTGSTCGGNSAKCSCDDGKTGMLDGACSDIPTGKKGAACGNCGTGATCTSNYCDCNTDYAGVVAGDCFVSAGKIGGGCSGTSGEKGSCSDADALCMTTGQGMTCKRALGGACTVDGDCSDTTTMMCDPTSNKCLIKVDQSCTGNTEKCVTGAACDATSGNTCKCGDGYQEVTASKTCKKVVDLSGTCTATDRCVNKAASSVGLVCDPYKSQCLIKVGQSCSGNTEKCVEGATCDNNVCTCKTDYEDKHDACSKKVTSIGATCKGFDTCSVASTNCDFLTGQCLLDVGASCTDNKDKCTTGATCSTSNTCSCGNGYTTSGTRCAAANGKPGGTCSSSIACTDANSECLNSVCVCKTGYKFKSDGATCEKDQDSGAVGVAASAVTVVLSAFFCPLFSLP